MFFRGLALLVLSSQALLTKATTTLSPGDLGIVAYASDSPDAFAFVTWVDIAVGTKISFTDKGWDCNGFQGTATSFESIIEYTAPSALTAGSVLAYEEGTSTSPDWVVQTGSVAWSSSGDQLIAYQGDFDDPTPIFAFDTTGGWEDCSAVGTSSTKSAIPDGLVDGESAVSFSHSDNFWYRPWYSTSAVLATLKEWMVDRSRFKYTTYSSTRGNDYEVPTSFTILTGERGANGYTEYIPGTAPCLILTGHDGDLEPSSIDDRNHGCYDSGTDTCDWSKTCTPQDDDECRAVTLNDENTQDMARRAVDYFASFSGERCHLVVNRLARIKLDPNREVEQGAQFDSVAIAAYNEFHAYAETAKDAITTSSCGAGVTVDFHGHAHPEGRIELGYKLTSTQLREDDTYVDGLAYTSSMKNLETFSGADFSTLIRGSVDLSNVSPTSMGALFELPTAFNSSGYISVPSPDVNAPPVGESYFQGGYNIEQHGSQYGGTIDGVQIEFPRWIRADNWDSQDDVLKAFGEVVLPKFLEHNYDFTAPYCP